MTRSRIGRGAPGYCLRCDELGADRFDQALCHTHGYLEARGLDLDAIDAAADRAGISVACLVREAIAHTVDALKRP